MMQGDACNLGIRILNNAGSPVTPEDVTDVEIVLGNLRKTLKSGGIFYHEGLWMLPLSQKETSCLWPAPVKAQVRVRWANGVVEGKAILGLRIFESISKEVL